jgi:hypothetical protein
LSIVKAAEPDILTPANNLTYATLAGALVFHISACLSLFFQVLGKSNENTKAILSFLASFVLVRYRHVESVDPDSPNDEAPAPEHASADSGKSPTHAFTMRYPYARKTHTVSIERFRIYDKLVTWVKRRVRRSHFPDQSEEHLSSLPEALSTLIRCNVVCMWMSSLGFILAITGILAFAWSWLARSISIFVSVCMFGSAVAGVYAIY